LLSSGDTRAAIGSLIEDYKCLREHWPLADRNKYPFYLWQ
jgi:hypothetical protein